MNDSKWIKPLQFSKELFRLKLKYAREFRRYTIESLSMQTGIHPGALSHYEHGRRMPSVKNLFFIQQALKVSMEYLVDPSIGAYLT